MTEAISFDCTHDESHDDCLSLRPLGDDDELFHLGEWHSAIGLLLQAAVPTVAFFVLRHMLELVLKRLIYEVTGTAPPWHHEVQELLKKLPDDDPLRVSKSEPETSIRALIDMVDALDRKGDAGRYAFSDRSRNRPSFDDDACVQRDTLSEAAEMLWDYTLARVGGYYGEAERLADHALHTDTEIDRW